MKKNSPLQVLIIVALLLFSSVFGAYKPGTYTASAYGKTDKTHSGLIEVEVILSANKIEDIKILTFDQSVDHKRYGPAVKQVEAEVPAAILTAQSIDIDGIAKATLASNAIQVAVAKILHEATVAYKPGTYQGSAMGRKSKDHSGVVSVEVVVSESKIESINVLEYEQSTDHEKYGPTVTEAKEVIPAAIIDKQSFGVDGVVKATLSSTAIELAVARALAKAR